MPHDDAWYEHQYMPSLSVGDAGAIIERWKSRSAATRAKLKFTHDIRYGAHPREVLDFYPATHAHGCLVFIHGGYWVEFSKIETSFVATGFVDQELSVALINYPLCPDVTIGDIRNSCVKAFVHLYKSVLSEGEREAIVVSGHSAGGHLAAAHLVQDWAKLGLPENPLAGVIALSGVFDVAPLAHTSLRADLHLDQRLAQALDLTKDRPRSSAPLALAVGALESSEFHRQSATLAESWKALRPELFDIAGCNHFTVVDSLANPGGQLNRLAVAMAQR